MPKQPEFMVEAHIPTYEDTTVGIVAQWCELVLSFKESGREQMEIQLTRAAGEAIIEVTNQALHPWSGSTIRETIWEALDEVMERLMSGHADADDKGQAQGLAMALAIFGNPYQPGIDAIKEEAMNRWEDVAAQRDSSDDDLPFG